MPHCYEIRFDLWSYFCFFTSPWSLKPSERVFSCCEVISIRRQHLLIHTALGWALYRTCKKWDLRIPRTYSMPGMTCLDHVWCLGVACSMFQESCLWWLMVSDSPTSVKATVGVRLRMNSVVHNSLSFQLDSGSVALPRPAKKHHVVQSNLNRALARLPEAQSVIQRITVMPRFTLYISLISAMAWWAALNLTRHAGLLCCDVTTSFRCVAGPPWSH